MIEGESSGDGLPPNDLNGEQIKQYMKKQKISHMVLNQNEKATHITPAWITNKDLQTIPDGSYYYDWDSTYDKGLDEIGWSGRVLDSGKIYGLPFPEPSVARHAMATGRRYEHERRTFSSWYANPTTEQGVPRLVDPNYTHIAGPPYLQHHDNMFGAWEDEVPPVEMPVVHRESWWTGATRNPKTWF
tara:strand:+ start:3104 stop:3664 length:561 start_codon:yes stop_codon:yes gene_type:complete